MTLSIHSRSAALGLAAALTLGTGGVAHAAVAQPHSRLLQSQTTSDRVVRFAAPTNDALVKSSTVPVDIQVGPKVTGVKVYAGSTDVSSRFARQGSSFTARLPRSLLKAGTDTLLVQAKDGGAARVSIVVPGSQSASMSMATGAHAASAPAAHAASVGGSAPADPGYLPSTPGQIPVVIHTETPTYASLTVNGHKVEDLRAKVALEDHHWIVSAADGLKVGANRFVVESWDKDGRHSVKRWTEQRSAAQPLTEAGPQERVVKPGAFVRLDGSKTKATEKGAKLGYAWRIVKAPKGAKPILRNATAAKPQFKPDTPGVYQLALRATQTKPGQSAAPNTASEDVTTVDAVPPITTQGQFISTAMVHLDGYWTIGIEGQNWCNTANSPDVRIQLDETTLAVLAVGDHTQITPKAGTITIGTWMSTPGITSDSYGSEIWIGTQQVAYNGDSSTPANDATAPHLNGWLEPAATANVDDATWVDSDMLQVKTRLPTDTPTTNTMEIDGVQHHTVLPAGATGGYHLIELDNAGAAKWQHLYSLTGNAAADATTQSALAFDIGNATPNTTFLLQGFGTLPAIASNSDLAAKLQSIGGRADVVSRFNGGTDSTGAVYSLISGRSSTDHNSWSTDAADEASYERTGTASQSALLVRDAYNNDYIPLTGDSSAPDPAGSNRYGIMPLAYAAPSSWADWIRNDDGTLRAWTPGEQAAWGDFYNQVLSHGWVPKTPLCPGATDLIRGYYCKTDANALQTLMGRISGQLHFNAATAGTRYTETDWDNVEYSIEDEIGDVSNIRSAIADYQGLFGTASIDGAVNAPAIGDAVKAAVSKANDVQTTASMDNLLSGLTDMASVIPEIGPPMTFLSGAFSLMANDEPDSNVDDVLANEQVTQDTAATTLVAAYQNASAELSAYGDMLVSDPVKLQQGAQFLMNNDPQTTDSNSEFVHAAEYATEQWLWGTDLSTAYSEWVVPNALGWSPDCAVGDNVGDPWSRMYTNTSAQWKSFEAQAPGQWSADDEITSPASRWLLGYDSDTGNAGDGSSYAIKGQNGTVPVLEDGSIPSSITDPLFSRAVSPTVAPSATAPAGAVMPYFALDYLKFKAPNVSPQSRWGQSNVFANSPNCEPHSGIPATD